jgi:hypothetical protein
MEGRSFACMEYQSQNARYVVDVNMENINQIAAYVTDVYTDATNILAKNVVHLFIANTAGVKLDV